MKTLLPLFHCFLLSSAVTAQQPSDTTEKEPEVIQIEFVGKTPHGKNFGWTIPAPQPTQLPDNFEELRKGLIEAAPENRIKAFEELSKSVPALKALSFEDASQLSVLLADPELNKESSARIVEKYTWYEASGQWLAAQARVPGERFPIPVGGTVPKKDHSEKLLELIVDLEARIQTLEDRIKTLEEKK